MQALHGSLSIGSSPPASSSLHDWSLNATSWAVSDALDITVVGVLAMVVVNRKQVSAAQLDTVRVAQVIIHAIVAENDLVLQIVRPARHRC